MSPRCILLWLSLWLPLGGAAQASPACAASVEALRVMLEERDFPLQWEETSMDDGKPLLMSIREKDGALHLEFTKSGEGLWAESAGVVCPAGTDFETRFTREQIRLGPAANWALRYALGSGGTFTLTKLGAGRLRIATGGWAGDFSPRVR